MSVNVQKLIDLMFSNKKLAESEPSLIKDFLECELLHGEQGKSKSDALKVVIELLKQLNTINTSTDKDDHQYSSLLSKVSS